MAKNIQLTLFELYSFVLNLLYMLLELFPGPIRKLVFRLLLKTLGKGCLIDYKTYLRFPSRMSIGSHVMINRGCEFYATFLKGGADIHIGDHVTFSPHVRLYTAAHDYSTLALDDKVGSITIEDHVWLGSGVIILPGVRIGKGAIIGAGSIVTRDVPPFSVSVGCPARAIKDRVVT